MLMAGDKGSTIRLRTESQKQIFSVDIFTNENSTWDTEKSRDILCENCVGRIAITNKYDVALINLANIEILIVHGKDA